MFCWWLQSMDELIFRSCSCNLFIFYPTQNVLLVWKFLHLQYCRCLEYKTALGDNMTRLQIAQEAFLSISVDMGPFLSLFVGPPCTWGVKSHCNKHSGSISYALRLKLAFLASIYHVDHLGYKICPLVATITGWINLWATSVHFLCHPTQAFLCVEMTKSTIL